SHPVFKAICPICKESFLRVSLRPLRLCVYLCDLLRLLEGPIVPSVGRAMTVRREKAAAKLPDPWPDLLAVCLRNFQPADFLPWKKCKPSLRMHRRERFQFHLYLE